MKDNNEIKYVYVLLEDGDMTLRSQPTPFGVCVTTEEEAKKFVEGKNKYYYKYEKLAIFDKTDEAIKWKYYGDGREEWEKEFDNKESINNEN